MMVEADNILTKQILESALNQMKGQVYQTASTASPTSLDVKKLIAAKAVIDAQLSKAPPDVLNLILAGRWMATDKQCIAHPIRQKHEVKKWHLQRVYHTRVNKKWRKRYGYTTPLMKKTDVYYMKNLNAVMIHSEAVRDLMRAIESEVVPEEMKMNQLFQGGMYGVPAPFRSPFV